MLKPQPIEVLGHVRQVQRHHQHVRDALGALGLEVVLRHPERVVAQPIHQHCHRLRLVQRGGKLFVRITSVVDRRAGVADILQVDMAGIRAVELLEHGNVLQVVSIVAAR